MLLILIRDHPRRCGENNPHFTIIARELGSPPQVRGKREEGIPVRVRQRITPAGAGKTEDEIAIFIPT